MSRRKRYRLKDLPEELRTRIKVHPWTGCWEWQHDDGPNPYQYGTVYWDGHMHAAYRLIFTMLAEPVTPGLSLDHVYARGCRAKSCCWPAHLEPVTPGENSRRAMRGNLVRGMRPWLLERIALGTGSAGEMEFADVAWMLPFDLHPGIPKPAHGECRSAPGPRTARPKPVTSVPEQEPEPVEHEPEVDSATCYSEHEAAKLLDVSVAFLRQAREDGTGPDWFRTPGSLGLVFYRRDWIMEWVEELVQRELREAA